MKETGWTITGVVVALGIAAPSLPAAIPQFLVGAVLLLWGGTMIVDGFIQTPETIDEQHSTNGLAQPKDDPADHPIYSSQTAKIAFLTEQNFSEPVWIPYRDTNGVVDENAIKTGVQSTAPEPNSSDLMYQKIIATKNDGSQVEMTAVVLFGNKSWKSGSYHLFNGDSPQGISPAKAIKQTNIEDEILSSLQTYCIGLASTEFKTDQIDDNTTLSDNRAIRLGNALFQPGLLDAQSKIHQVIAIGVGERIPSTVGDSPPDRQRAAIIVRVSKIEQHHTHLDVVDSLTAGLTAGGVRLGNYKRSDRRDFELFVVDGSEFHSATSDHWDIIPNLENSRVLNQDASEPFGKQ